VAAGATAALVGLAVVATAGRVRAVPVESPAPDAGVRAGALAFVEPVPVLRLAAGDRFLARPEAGGPVELLRVATTDSWAGAVTARDRRGRLVTVQPRGPVWRVRASVAHAGNVFGVLAGPVPAAALAAGGLVLVAVSRQRRRAFDRSGDRSVGGSGDRSVESPDSGDPWHSGHFGPSAGRADGRSMPQPGKAAGITPA
jgi:hypothetical protein